MKRRDFLKSATVTSSTLLLNTTAPAHAANIEAPQDPELSFFTPQEREALTSLTDYIFPGAGALGATRYIERLVTALEFDPPRIYVGGPYTNAPNAVAYIPLNRVQTAAWRLYLYGSASNGGAPNEALTGPIEGLRNSIGKIASLATRPGTNSILTWGLMSIEQQQILTELVVQSVLSKPEYGGNLNKEGWKMINFEGESLPNGYKGPTLSERDPGADPYPVGFLTRFFLSFKNGK